MPEPALAVEQPAALPIQSATLTFREQREATEKGLTEVPAVKADDAAPVVDETAAVQEADSTKPDAELSEAGRKLRGNRLDARKLKLQGEITELNELLRQRKELRETIAAVPSAPAVAETRPATPAIDPRDPEPTFETFLAANPGHPDPYEGAILAKGDWRVRQHLRSLAQSHQEQQAQHSRTESLASYHAQADEIRAQHSDFDAVTQPVLDQFQSHPHAGVLDDFLRAETLGPRILYHLAKHPDALKELAHSTRPYVVLGEIKATVKAALKPAPATSITRVPAPPSQTAGAGATAPTETDPTSTGAHLRKRAAEDADRRSRGLR